jgi:hypothetical protein
MKDPWKELVGNVGALSPTQPRNVVSVPVEGGPNSSLATLYVHLDGRAAFNVAVRLEAELLGTRGLVGTAGIPPGFDGLAIIATGIVADCWHASAYGVLPQGSLDCKLGVRPCCSGHRVEIPAALQHDVPSLKTLEPASVLPLSRHEGKYNLLWGTDGNEQIFGVERILRVVAIADEGQGGLSGFASTIIHWPAGTRFDAYPRGNSEGPRTLTFTNTVYYQVEVVS